MGESYPKIVFGAFIQDLDSPCPDEDGWGEWVFKHEALESIDGSPWKKGLFGRRLVSSYESTPAWVGFQCEILGYGDAREVSALKANKGPSVKAWERLRELALKEGVEFPVGKLIFAYDE